MKDAQALRRLAGSFGGHALVAAPQGTANSGRWDTEHMRIFDLARNVNDRLRTLFAGAGASQAPDHLLGELDQSISSLHFAVHTSAGRFAE